jgi:hypothetical protein
MFRKHFGVKTTGIYGSAGTSQKYTRTGDGGGSGSGERGTRTDDMEPGVELGSRKSATDSTTKIVSDFH